MGAMKNNEIVCTMCGTTFDPANHASCQSCPLNKNCTLVCCPVCGFETVDPSQSRLARLASLLFARKNSTKSFHQEKEF
jgi:hypothetical protein